MCLSGYRFKDTAKSHIVRGAWQAGKQDRAAVQTQSRVLVEPSSCQREIGMCSNQVFN